MVKRIVMAGIVLVLSAALFSGYSYAEEKGLVGLWRFDEGVGEVAGDSSGKGNNGVLEGSPKWVECKSGKALKFDGAEDYVDCGNDESLDITGAITLEAWLKLNSNTEEQQVLIYKDGFSASNGYRLYISKNLRLGFMLGQEDGYDVRGDTVPLHSWVHVAGRWSKSSGKMETFFNGVQSSTVTAKINGIGITPKHVILGRHSNNDYELDGAIDEVRIYNRALTDKEIKAHFEAREPPIVTGVLVKKDKGGAIDKMLTTPFESKTKSLLVIGDSISVGYGPYLKKMTNGAFSFYRIFGGDSNQVLNILKKHLKKTKMYDIVVLNCGLHDLRTYPETQKKQVDIKKYERNLDTILKLIHNADAHPIWVTTTPVTSAAQPKPNSKYGRYKKNVIEYNNVAKKIMEKNNIPIIDLYIFTKNLGGDIHIDGVHFKENIRALQAAFIAGNIFLGGA